MQPPLKKISIITINLNNAAGLEKTIPSVVCQSFRDFEFIVIDGGSTDGSTALLQQHRQEIDVLVSETDNGVYAAMNKGIGLATGEYCYFLNSGDCFSAAESLQKVFAAAGGEDILYGNMIHGGPETIEHGLPQLRFFDFFVGSIFHQSAFIKRNLFATVGLYNETLRIVSDWEFFLKAIFLHHCTYKYVNVEVARYEPGGLSFQNEKLNAGERAAVLDRLFPLFTDDYSQLKKYRQSELSGIFRAIETKRAVRMPLLMAVKASRFIRFTIFRRPY